MPPLQFTISKDQVPSMRFPQELKPLYGYHVRFSPETPTEGGPIPQIAWQPPGEGGCETPSYQVPEEPRAVWDPATSSTSAGPATATEATPGIPPRHPIVETLPPPPPILMRPREAHAGGGAPTNQCRPKTHLGSCMNHPEKFMWKQKKIKRNMVAREGIRLYPRCKRPYPFYWIKFINWKLPARVTRPKFLLGQKI